MAKRTYAEKKASGQMMYGPAPKTPKYPEFRPGAGRRKMIQMFPKHMIERDSAEGRRFLSEAEAKECERALSARGQA